MHVRYVVSRFLKLKQNNNNNEYKIQIFFSDGTPSRSIFL